MHRRLLTELSDLSGALLDQVPEQAVRRAVQELTDATAVFVGGVGHSGLIARTFAMKLNHVGISSYTLYDEINPPFKPGDCLVAVSQSGKTATIVEMASKAKNLGGRLLAVSGARDSPLAAMADHLIEVPPVSDGAVIRELSAFGGVRHKNVQGVVFGFAIFVLFYSITAQIAECRHESPESIDARHANLE